MMRGVLQLVEQDRRRFLGMLVLHVIKASPTWILPVVTANVINIITDPGNHPPEELLWNGLILFGFLLQNVYTHTAFQNLLSRILRNTEATLRGALTRRIQHLSMTFLDRSESGRLQSKVLRDVESVQMFYNQLVVSVFSGGVLLAVAMGVTLYRRPVIALGYVIMVPICVVLVRRFRRSLERVNRLYRESMERMSARIIEMIEMLPVTRAHGIEDAEIRRMDRQYESVRSSGVRLDTISAIFNAALWVTFQLFQMSFLFTLAWLAYRGDVRIGGWTVFAGKLPVGDVVLFHSFFTMIVTSVSTILGVFPILSKGVESLRSIGEVLESPDIERNAGKLPVAAVAGCFTFENVSYTYAGAPRPAVAEFSLEVKAGECVAVVGGSGSGKSTLMSLIVGFRRPQSGRLLLDGRDMETLDLRQYRRDLAVVPQNTLLFNGTIRENITYGLPGVTDAEIWRAVEIANCAEFIQALPKGLDSPLGAHGGRLSGGQKQRISIARALLRDPQVIIFDEATSALDVASERLVQEAIARMVKGRTTFIVAHRFSTIRIATRIVVLKDGRCVECGPAEELLARDGEFRRLHRLQS